jgi:non-haem Fe2+, alpha-ketoglutarate-dependent halogenase
MRTHALTPAELAFFDEHGYVGPFRVYEPDEAAALLTAIRCKAPDRSRAIFGDSTINYDRHLDIPELGHHVTRPQIVDRVASLIGPDLLCWRTEFFTKRRGEAATGWHQVETYAVGGGPAMLTPTERRAGVPTEMTVWTTLTEATREMSCLKFLPGSHKRWYYDEHRTMSFRADEVGSERGSFFGYDYDELKLDPNWEPDEREVVHLDMQPGECVLFTARTVHGSASHLARKARVAVAARYVPTSVQVYAGMDHFDEFGERLSTAQHANVLVAGVDRHAHNRIAERNAWGGSFFASGNGE